MSKPLPRLPIYTTDEIADAVGMPPHSVRHHVRKFCPSLGQNRFTYEEAMQLIAYIDTVRRKSAADHRVPNPWRNAEDELPEFGMPVLVRVYRPKHINKWKFHVAIRDKLTGFWMDGLTVLHHVRNWQLIVCELSETE